MLLKKQTVWLLTMLSLVVVLSVYYLTSPESSKDSATTQQQMKDDQLENKAMGENSKSNAKVTGKDAKTNSEASVKITSGDDEFDAIRMQIDDERSKLSEELMKKVGNPNLSTEEINKAYEAVQQLSETKVEENILEGMIVSMNYDAALVRIEGKNVKVTVRAKEHTAADANKIIRLVRGEITDANDIVVDFQIKK